MKYANQINFVIAVIAVVVIGFALSRTYWSGEPAYPETAVPALDETSETEVPLLDRGRPAGEPAPGRVSRPVAAGVGRPLPGAGSVPSEPEVEEESSEPAREKAASGAVQDAGAEPIVIQRPGADRETTADRNESGQTSREDPGGRSQQLEDDEQPQAPAALPGSGGTQRRQSPPPPPTRSSMPGDLP